jgi:hypothetical protein
VVAVVVAVALALVLALVLALALTVRFSKSHWKQKSISLGAKRVSHQEVSSVALSVTRYPMTYTYEKQEGKAVCLHL